MKVTINDWGKDQNIILDGGTADTKFEFRLFDKNVANHWEKLARNRGFICITYVTGGRAVRNKVRRHYDEEETIEYDRQLDEVRELENDLRSRGIYGYYEIVEGHREQGGAQYDNELSVLVPYCTLGMDENDRKYREVRSVGEDEVKDAVAWVEDLAQLAHEHGQQSILICMPRYFTSKAFYFDTSNDHPAIPSVLIRKEVNTKIAMGSWFKKQMPANEEENAGYRVGDSKKIRDARLADLYARDAETAKIVGREISFESLRRICESFIGYRVPLDLGDSVFMRDRGHLIATNNYDEEGNRLDFFLEPIPTEHYDSDDCVVINERSN